ncbi:hypothetical protein DM01DRAFT_1371327 [Hesseltinella vesiculosa]|uniref:Uncharacterized protein n=1 Tax=Hesseltinella vesiculosa TaxID=101127 RepID=A0A1X2GQN7_9FUNG|nr:hypothetical protein DM01DRAFT_1371327 [Hesseltinella vesiculosa]
MFGIRSGPLLSTSQQTLTYSSSDPHTTSAPNVSAVDEQTASPTYVASPVVVERFSSLFTDEPASITSTTPVTATDATVYRKRVFATCNCSVAETVPLDETKQLRHLARNIIPTTLTTISSILLILRPKTKLMGEQPLLRKFGTYYSKTYALSLSRIVDCVNPLVAKVFKTYFQDADLWSKVDDMQVNMLPGLKTNPKEMLDKVERKSSEISKERTRLLDSTSTDVEARQVLDLLGIVVKRCLSDLSLNSPSGQSELTYYRNTAQLLDIILEDTPFDLVDGENTCGATKRAGTINKDLVGLGLRVGAIDVWT